MSNTVQVQRWRPLRIEQDPRKSRQLDTYALFLNAPTTSLGKCKMWQDYLWEGLKEAFRLIITGDPELTEITLRSLQVSFIAVLIASAIGVPLGIAIGMRDFKGKRFLKTIFTALIGMPTVALGLILFLLLARNGPFGYFQLLYTVQGISLGEAILVIPIVVSFTTSAIESKERDRLKDLAHTLGASELDTSMSILREASTPIVLAVIAAFNRAFAELGVAMMLGANIRGLTRVLTTNIALQTAMGEIGLSIALSIILMTVVFTLNIITSNIGAIVNTLKKDI
jgi:tungstate transport system permease protein